MEPSLDIFAILNFLGAIQGGFLAFALFTIKRGNSAANFLLGSLLLGTSIVIININLYYTGYIFSFPHMARIHSPINVLIGPLFFFYVKFLTTRGFRFRKYHGFHIIPFVINIIYLVPFYLQSGDEKIAYLMAVFDAYPLEWYIINGLKRLYNLIYLLLTLRLLIKYSRKMKSDFFSIERVNLNWLRNLMIMFLIVLLISIFIYLVDFRFETIYIVPSVLSIIIYIVGYMGLRRPEIFTGVEEKPVQKYQRSTLTPEDAEKYLGKLIHLMKAEKPYTDSNLTLQKLARKLEISPPHLSQIINEKLNQNFFDYVNSYRISEVKRLMAKPDRSNDAIMTIAYDAGYNSKSTFNTAFKKHTDGMTPSQYRKKTAFESRKGSK